MNSRWFLLAAGLVIAACDGGGGGTGGDGGTGGSGGGAGGDGGSGGVGDGSCTVDAPCGNGEVCIFPQGSCDAGAKGSCQGGFTCDGPPSGPLCQCDGTVLEGEMAECDVWGDSLPYAEPDVCATGTFPCGMMECTKNIQVCVVMYPGVPGAEPSFECKDFADVNGTCAHGIADCSCIDTMKAGCPDTSCCMADAEGQETLSIYLP